MDQNARRKAREYELRQIKSFWNVETRILSDFKLQVSKFDDFLKSASRCFRLTFPLIFDIIRQAFAT